MSLLKNPGAWFWRERSSKDALEISQRRAKYLSDSLPNAKATGLCTSKRPSMKNGKETSRSRSPFAKRASTTTSSTALFGSSTCDSTRRCQNRTGTNALGVCRTSSTKCFSTFQGNWNGRSTLKLPRRMNDWTSAIRLSASLQTRFNSVRTTSSGRSGWLPPGSNSNSASPTKPVKLLSAAVTMCPPSKSQCLSSNIQSILKCAKSVSEPARLWHIPSTWVNQSGRLTLRLSCLRSAVVTSRRPSWWSLIRYNFTLRLADFGPLWFSCNTHGPKRRKTSTKFTSHLTRLFEKFQNQEKYGAKERGLRFQVILLTDTLISRMQKTIWSLQFSLLHSTVTRSWSAYGCTWSQISLKK